MWHLHGKCDSSKAMETSPALHAADQHLSIDQGTCMAMRAALADWYTRFQRPLPWRKRPDPYGIWVSEVIDHGFILSIYTFDPNNIAIEFSVPQQAIDLRKNPKMKDTHSLPEALEGPEPNPAYRLIYESTPLEQRYIYPGEGEVFKDDDRQS